MIKKGFKFEEISKEDLAEKYANEFLEDLNAFHAEQYPRDKEIDLYLHKCYYEILQKDIRDHFKGVEYYFSPSSVNSCPRELYLKNTGAKKDSEEIVSYRTRWQNIGTLIGDMIQKDVLLMQKYKKDARFFIERDGNNFPMFEEFAYTSREIEFNGNKFHLIGTTDGIMSYKNKTRVGLEIKSKQTTYSSTGYFSMKEADPKHIAQCTAYALMYNVDYWVICYVNACKKGWNMTEEEVAKYPDVRTFGVYVTDEMKINLLKYISDVVSAIKNEEMPELDITKWTFNNYKEACLETLTYKDIERVDKEYNNGDYDWLPKYQLKNIGINLENIKEKLKERGQI